LPKNDKKLRLRSYVKNVKNPNKMSYLFLSAPGLSILLKSAGEFYRLNPKPDFSKAQNDSLSQLVIAIGH
jgi:hypothetical protein